MSLRPSLEPNFGFVIDNRSCIGCHACSTACKSENEVPLGVYRTWVKTTEVGQFPDTRRHFQVTRCNHCSNPPCVSICPTSAMYQRDDGIVDFDHRSCIGCKGCLQACPYDAIYIDPESGTAAKCNYCSHRTDLGLEPSCVVVCPEHAILAGDLNDPKSEISRVLAKERVTVRKPEQGTGPKLFYIEGAQVNLQPTATPRTPTTFAAADVVSLHGGVHQGPASGLPDVDAPGPLRIAGRKAGQIAQVGYNAQHKVPWHWPVWTYLVTKGVATGIVLVLALLWGVLGVGPSGTVAAWAAGISLVMTAATTALLVLDLEHPSRFFYILTRPQWRSWLTRGAVLLIAFSLGTGLWGALEIGAQLGLLDPSLASRWRMPLIWLNTPLAVGTAIYTAFLFGQAEGRDFWQSPLLPLQLLVQAFLSGAAVLVLALPVYEHTEDFALGCNRTLAISVGLHLFVLVLGEFAMPHATDVARQAAYAITRGAYRTQFAFGVLVVGHILPLGVWMASPGSVDPGLAAFPLIGLFLYERLFVKAPQEVPNS